MTSSQKNHLIVLLAVVAILAVAVAAVTLFWVRRSIGRQLKTAIAPFENPEAITRYNQWIAGTGVDEGAASNPAETIEAFSKAFERAKTIDMDEGPEWQWYWDMDVDAWMSEGGAKLTALLDGAPGLLQEIRRLAATGGPAVALDFSKGYNVELPHLAQLRGFARILCAHARLQAQQGDYEGATVDIMSTIRLSGVLENEPVLISQLVRIAMILIAYETVGIAIPKEGFPPALARDMAACAARADCREAMADALAGEGYLGVMTLEYVREAFVYNPRSSTRTAGGVAWLLGKCFGPVLARAWFEMDEVAFADIMSRIIDASRSPYYEAKASLDRIGKEADDLPRTRFLSHDQLRKMVRSPLAQAECKATLDLIQIGLAVEQYLDRHGTCPRTLDGVADRIGDVPVDPFTGEAYRYRLTDAGFVLYSVGEDLIDDNGRHDYRTGDIVWRGKTDIDTERGVSDRAD